MHKKAIQSLGQFFQFSHIIATCIAGVCNCLHKRKFVSFLLWDHLIWSFFLCWYSLLKVELLSPSHTIFLSILIKRCTHTHLSPSASHPSEKSHLIFWSVYKTQFRKKTWWWRWYHNESRFFWIYCLYACMFVNSPYFACEGNIFSFGLTLTALLVAWIWVVIFCAECRGITANLTIFSRWLKFVDRRRMHLNNKHGNLCLNSLVASACMPNSQIR